MSPREAAIAVARTEHVARLSESRQRFAALVIDVRRRGDNAEAYLVDQFRERLAEIDRDHPKETTDG